MAARKGQGKGNGHSLKHGAIALRDLIKKQTDPAHPVMVLVNDKASGYMTERGGPANLSGMEQDSLKHAATLDLLGTLILNRFLSPYGRPKRMNAGRFRDLIVVYCRVVDSYNRIGLAVGLQRRAKELPSLQEFLNKAASDGQGHPDDR